MLHPPHGLEKPFPHHRGCQPALYGAAVPIGVALGLDPPQKTLWGRMVWALPSTSGY